ncbi:MAG: imelysin family protein [Chitinophagales bacterium]
MTSLSSSWKIPHQVIFLLLIFSITSCTKDDPNDPSVTYDATELLKNVPEEVITATYVNLEQQANALIDAVENLQSNPSESNLEDARAAWRLARTPWEQSEGFLFGPVATQGIDPSIDSWPVNTVDLDAVLASSAVLTKDYIDGLDGTLKGFHTTEYLLFGTDGNKEPSAFNSREFEYLVAVAQSLHGATDQLKNAWSASGENFQINLVNAGKSGSIYPSQKSALQELINGLIGIADEVGNGKINDPFSQEDLLYEESRFSNNSKADFADNIRSIQNIYLGTITTPNGIGLSDFVVSQNNDLDVKVKQEVQSAIDKIEAIPGTFGEAVFNNKAAVQSAQDAVRLLQQTLESEVKPLIDELQ